MRVVLAEDGSEWARQVPPWAAGFAIGEAGLVVLFPSRSPLYPHDTLEDVLRHEVAHVLISRAAAGHPVPRWFHEGLAVAVERPWDLEDRTRLASALLFGPRLGLMEIDAHFAGDEAALALETMTTHPSSPVTTRRTIADLQGEGPAGLGAPGQ